MVSVSILGIGRLQRKFDSLVRETDTELVSTMNKGAGVVLGTAKSIVAVDKGTLRSSLHIIPANHPVEGSVTSGVATSVEHAPYVEFGTGTRGGSEAASKLGVTFGDKPGQEAQPFLYPALQQNKDKISGLVSQVVMRAARKVK